MYIFESIKTAETCATFSTEAVTFSRAMRNIRFLVAKERRTLFHLLPLLKNVSHFKLLRPFHSTISHSSYL